MAIKIKTYRVAKSGKRGNHLTLPKAWLDDLVLAEGDKLDVYRDEDDRLIVCPPGVLPRENLDRSSVQARETKGALQGDAR